MRTLVFVLTLGFLCALAGTASASYVSVLGQSSGTVTVTYTASTGEANRLNITRDGTDVIVEDPGATITAASWSGQPACTGSGGHSIRCPHLGAQRFGASATLGDLDDQASVAAGFATATATLDGGAGADTLTIDSGSLGGGPGNDVLRMRTAYDWNNLDGGAGDDELHGGPGIDFLVGGPGSDLIDGAGGNDTLHDGATSDADAESDTLIGGPGVDALYSHGGVDTLQGGDDTDYVFASDAESAPGSPTAGAADAIDCGAGTDYYGADAVDALTACEHVFDRCTSPPYPGRPFTPCAPESAPAAPAPPAATGPSPAPPPPPPAAAKSRLTVKLALDERRVRPPLTRIPRGLIRLSSTAEVTLTLVREAGRRRVALPGTISRRLGTGERDISLTVLLGGRRTFAAGRYWVIATARTADGRGATTQAVLRVLRPKRARR